MPKLALYHYTTCFFCHRVRSALSKMGIEAELRDIHKEARWRSELMEARNRSTVPVLRIESEDGTVEWMGESRDIVVYLSTLQ
jgi:glutathione S-transferase